MLKWWRHYMSQWTEINLIVNKYNSGVVEGTVDVNMAQILEYQVPVALFQLKCRNVYRNRLWFTIIKETSLSFHLFPHQWTNFTERRCKMKTFPRSLGILIVKVLAVIQVSRSPGDVSATVIFKRHFLYLFCNED